MKSLLKFTALSTAILFSGSVALAAYAPSATFEDAPLETFKEYNNPFNDTHILMLEGKAAAEAFRRGITSGYQDGRFKGHQEINRAEAAKFLVQARFGKVYETESENEFTDVKPAHWFYSHVKMAASQGIINGYPDNTFRAGNTINTAEFLKMMSKAFDLADNLPHSFVDIDPNAWYAPLAGIAETYKLFPERENKLDPGRNLTRTEVAIALYNYFKNRGNEIPKPITSSKLKIEGEVYPHHKNGPAEGKVAIDIHGSLEEPHTRTLMNTLKDILKDYPDDVRLIWNYFPISSYNLTEYKTANAIECAADQEKFWEYLYLILEQDPDAFGRALYLNAANRLELNIKKFEICIDEEPYLSRIAFDKEQANKQGLNSVPTMYINGSPHEGAKSYDYIKNVIEEELSKSN